MSAGAQLRRASGLAARYGRMTREDSLELASVFVQVAGRQAKDALTAAGQRVEQACAGLGKRLR